MCGRANSYLQWRARHTWLLYSVFISVCLCMSSCRPQLTVAGLSRWRSLPQRLLSAQTQTGPEESEGRQGEEREWGSEKCEGDSWTITEVHLLSARVVQRHKQIGCTLVRTKPGLWSLMCSSEAAMSISFTPNNKNSKSITITVWESSWNCSYSYRRQESSLSTIKLL